MTHPPPRSAATRRPYRAAPTGRHRRAGTACAAGFVTAMLAACGGGGEARVADTSAPASAARVGATTPALAWVQVQGCVVDRYFIPRTGTPVRALAPDGRLLGNGSSDADGRFTLRLPAGAGATLAVDLPGGETQAISVGGAETRVASCLADTSA